MLQLYDATTSRKSMYKFHRPAYKEVRAGPATPAPKVITATFVLDKLVQKYSTPARMVKMVKSLEGKQATPSPGSNKQDAIAAFCQDLLLEQKAFPHEVQKRASTINSGGGSSSSRTDQSDVDVPAIRAVQEMKDTNKSTAVSIAAVLSYIAERAWDEYCKETASK